MKRKYNFYSRIHISLQATFIGPEPNQTLLLANLSVEYCEPVAEYPTPARGRLHFGAANMRVILVMAHSVRFFCGSSDRPFERTLRLDLFAADVSFANFNDNLSSLAQKLIINSMPPEILSLS